MMDKGFWQRIASFWTSIQSEEECERTKATIELLFNDAMEKRKEEKTLVELLMSGLDDEEDDDGY